jgi:hypothetical protein
MTLLASFSLGIAWLLWRFYRTAHPLGVTIFACVLATFSFGIMCLGFFELFVHRHVEIHVTTRSLVNVRRALGRLEKREAYSFDEMSRIVLEERPGRSGIIITLVIEMRDGRHVDLGGVYRLAEGLAVAERLSRLTGVESSRSTPLASS